MSFKWISAEEDWKLLTNSLKEEYKDMGLEEGRTQEPEEGRAL